MLVFYTFLPLCLPRAVFIDMKQFMDAQCILPSLSFIFVLSNIYVFLRVRITMAESCQLPKANPQAVQGIRKVLNASKYVFYDVKMHSFTKWETLKMVVDDVTIGIRVLFVFSSLLLPLFSHLTASISTTNNTIYIHTCTIHSILI